MTVANRIFLPLFAVLVGFLLLASAARADFSGGEESPLSEIYEQIEAGRYEAALAGLQELEAEDPRDADVHNLLGYTFRKMGRYDESYEHYQTALEIDPEHKGALEYLGELYLRTDRLAEAEATLERLSDACGFFGCDEEDELEEAIAAYKAQKGS